jgi:hypothetical protein
MGFRLGHPLAEGCRLGRGGFGGEKQLKSSFDPEGTAPKCPSRLGGLEIAGSPVDDIPSGILWVFSLCHLGRRVGGVSHVVGRAGIGVGRKLLRREASVSETISRGPSGDE